MKGRPRKFVFSLNKLLIPLKKDHCVSLSEEFSYYDGQWITYFTCSVCFWVNSFESETLSVRGNTLADIYKKIKEKVDKRMGCDLGEIK